jgi:hypothetical protein
VKSDTRVIVILEHKENTTRVGGERDNRRENSNLEFSPLFPYPFLFLDVVGVGEFKRGEGLREVVRREKLNSQEV